MRRDTFAAGSQPVRNLLGNPSCETAGSVTALRQNLAWNPNMLGVTGALAQVRINRCVNPRGVLTFLHYSGPGAQTITPNVAITGGPENIATATRVTFSSSASNPGINIMSPIAASTMYTMSAWIYIESLPTDTPGGGGFAENGVISGTSYANTVGVWQKISWTRTTTATPGPNFGIRHTGLTGGAGTGSILITGIVIEITDAAGASPTFFDGATPAGGGFTYRWTGAANNSISEQNAPTVSGVSARWFGSGGGAGASYQMLGAGIGGSTSFRKLWKIANTGNSNDTGISVTVPVTAGFTYTGSISQNPSFTTNLAIFIAWLDSGGGVISQTSSSLGVASPAGVWTRHFATGLAPAGSVNAMFVFGPYNTPGPTASPATPSGATIDWDDCLIEVASVMMPFFSGNTPASGDFTYGFTATANASPSQMRGLGVVGVSSSGTAGIIQSSEWSSSGTKSVRVIHIPISTIAEGIIADIQTMKPGRTYTAIGKLRLDTVATNSHTRSRRFNFYWSNNGGASYSEVNGPQAPNAVGVHDVRITFTVPADATHSILRLGPNSFGPTIPMQADAWWDDLMLVDGVYTGDYVDGTKPFSKWDGAAHASTSVGYPQQLLDIAGTPVHDITATGSTTLNAVFDPREARTIYTVYQNFAKITDSQVPLILIYGSTALNDVVPNTSLTLRQQQSSTVGNNLIARRTGGQGPLVSRSQISSNVACWGIDPTGKAFLQVNNEPMTIDTVAMDIPNERINVSGPVAASSHTRTLIYRGMHDATTRAAITKYLANKYGGYTA